MSNYSAFDAIEMQEVHNYEQNLDKAKQAVKDRFYDTVAASSNKKQALRELHQDIQGIVSEYLVPLPSTMRRVKSVFNDKKSKKITSEWSFDQDFNGWVAKEGASDFLCSNCGRTLAKLGYQDCPCGKIWNGYTIVDNSSKTSHSPVIVWREIENRSDMKVAREKEAYPNRNVSTDDKEEIEKLEEKGEDAPISEEPIYDYDIKETHFVHGYVDAKSGVFLKKNASFYYKEGYKSALGIK